MATTSPPFSDPEFASAAVAERWRRHHAREDERAETRRRLLDLANGLPSELKTVKDCQQLLGVAVPAVLAGTIPVSRGMVVVRGAEALIRALHEGEPAETAALAAQLRALRRGRGAR